jgi:Ca2+-binding RTX toxin-like protein
MRYYQGTAGNDFIVADSDDDATYSWIGHGSDVVKAGQGNDVFQMTVDLLPDYIDGNGGENRLDYSGSQNAPGIDLNALSIDLNDGKVFGTFIKTESSTFVGPDGNIVGFAVMQPYQALVATMHHIQDVTGSNLADTIIGDAGDNKIDGGGGDDHIFGGAGANTLNGGDGNDTITLQLEGIGGSTLDTIDGGNDVDTLAFSVTPGLPGTFGVDVNLSSHEVDSIHYLDGTLDGPIQSRGEASVTNVENVTGTDQSDVIVGDGKANTLIGNGGDDVLQGGGGNDYLDGGAGNDRFIEFGANHGGDVIHGGGDVDTVVYTHGGGVTLGATDPDHAVKVTLAEPGNAGTAIMFVDGPSPLSPPTAVVDYLYDIQNVTGSDFNDTLIGNSQDNTLLGGFGEDSLSGSGGKDLLNGGPGHDVLTGGADADTFQFSDLGVGANGDTITDFTTGVDHIDFSPFYSKQAEFHIHTGGDQSPPTFIGDHAFSGAGNELRVFTSAGGDTIVQLQTDGLGTHTAPDVEINLGHHAVSQHDFLF